MKENPPFNPPIIEYRMMKKYYEKKMKNKKQPITERPIMKPKKERPIMEKKKHTFSVIRSKTPTQFITSEKIDEHSDEHLWNCYKLRITYQAFKEQLPKIRAYYKQIRVSEGFDIDIDVVPEHATAGERYLVPDDFCLPEKYEALMNLAKLAIGFYNKDNRKLFQRFEVDKIVRLNTRLDGLYNHHYITFTAVNVGRRGVRGDPVTFQTMVLVMGGLLHTEHLEKIIDFVRIKPEPVEQD